MSRRSGPEGKPDGARPEPYADAGDLLSELLELVQHWLRRYVAIFGHRMVQTGGTLDDLYVSVTEANTWLRDDVVGGVTSKLKGWPSRAEAEARVVAHRQLMAAREEATLHAGRAELPAQQLRRSMGLTDSQLDLLLAAVAPMMSVDVARLYTFAWADFAVKQPTVGFLCELVGASPQGVRALLGELGAEGTLRRTGLLELRDSPRWGASTPLIHSLVSVPRSVAAALMGLPAELPPRLRDITTWHPSEQAQPLSELRLSEETQGLASAALRECSTPGPAPKRLLLLGARGSGRRTLLAALLTTRELGVLELDLGRSNEGGNALASLLLEACREAGVRGAALLVRADEALDGGPRVAEVRAALNAMVERGTGLVVLTMRRPSTELDAVADRLLTVPVPSPSRTEQEALWARALGGAPGAGSSEGAGDMAASLGARYDLTPGAIRRATDAATAHAALRRSAARRRLVVTEADIDRAVKQQIRHAMGEIASRVETTATWDDVVLPQVLEDKLREVVAYVRHSAQVYERWGFSRTVAYGRGLSCLFAGPSGTGKTMMAGIVARELGRDMYRIDLSRVASKWVGETEKNLARVFDEAEKAQVVLLFDEADSLFSQRTGIQSANDRFANMEVNFLLQRMESFDGISILTTNFATSIDDAFQRRLRFRLTFPMPDAQIRERLWRSMVPPEAAMADDVDFEELATRFELSGGNIKNALVRAAFLAAEESGVITHALLHRAGVAEASEIGQAVRG